MKRTLLLLFVLLITLTVAPLFPARKAHAIPPDELLGESAGFLILFPELRTLPKPSWFVPGARASYQSIGATFGGGSAGGGIVQYDAVASDGEQSLASVQTFTDNGAGQLVPAGWGMILAAPAVGEYWLHPFALARAEDVADQNLSVVRLTKTYAGITVNVVRFQSEFPTSRTVWEFDTATGLLMFYSKAINSGGVESASQLQFLNFRTLTLPWATGRAPNWVRNGVTLDYTGQQAQTIPGAGPISAPFAIRTVLNPTSLTWSIDTQTAFLNGTSTGNPTVRTTGIGQFFGGTWLPREALGVNVQGEVIIDEDPVTGVVTTLQRDPSTNRIVLRQVNDAHDIFASYNPTLGVLERTIQTISSPTNIMHVDVRRTGGDDLEAINQLPELPTPISGVTASSSGPTVVGEATSFNVQFSGGEPTSYAWDFGDGTTGSGASPSHTYAAPGNYTVTVEATNAANSVTATTTVLVVADAPTAISGLTASNDGPTETNATTAFAATFTGGEPTSYSWSFGDGVKGSGASPNHTYATAGVYTATVVATNATNSMSATTTVYVGDAVVEVRNSRYSPAEVTVPPGGTVVWVLVEGNHSVTADDGSFEQPAGSNWPPFMHTFDLPDLQAAGTNATISYHCTVHGQSMTGTVTVEVVEAPTSGNALYMPKLAQ